MAVKVCLDAGHYGKYNRSPAVSSYYESDMTWKLHNYLKKELESFGIVVVTTRTNQNTDRALYERGAASKGCNLFISVHSNAVGNGVNENVDYPVAYVLLNGSSTDIGLKLAKVVEAVMGTAQSGRTATRQGTNGEYYGVLRGANAVGTPGIILEHSFHTNTRATKWLSIDSNLQKLAKAEAECIGFFEKAIELAEDEELKKDITGNYFIALLENEQFKEAEKVMCDLIEEYPCNQNFSNYAELLKRQGKLEDALEWGKKALFIVEDDTTLLVVADIYKKMKQYENAVFMYQKCLEHISVDENVYQFQDINGKQLYSIASNNSLGVIMFEALKGIISAYSFLREYEQAKAYLLIAKERMPQKSEWEIWEQTLPEIESANQRYIEIKEQLSQNSKKAVEQKRSVRQWALQLIQLQNNSGQLNLDENDDWDKYLEKMDEVLNQMVQAVNKDSIIYQNSRNWVNSTYTHLDADAKEFLITAETLYEIHKMSIIDFAPIIVEYCKVVEKQLRVLLGSQIPSSMHMLGQIIGVISTNNIHPYTLYLSDLRAVNQLRRNSAHTGLLVRNDADTIRNILYVNNLLNNLV